MKARVHLPRLPHAPGHHWKSMTATLAAFTLAGFLAIANGWLITGVALLLGVGAIAVQWFCVDPPDVDEVDLHGSKTEGRAAVSSQRAANTGHARARSKAP